ncbi:MAG TPA: hypothetical protein VF377_04085 [Acidimicrobiia bacterium]|jgi:hypothetical protein
MRRADLVVALEGARKAHHEYETVSLAGEPDAMWPAFYAAFVIGRLGEVTSPSRLVAILESVQGEPWPELAADAVLEAIR